MIKSDAEMDELRQERSDAWSKTEQGKKDLAEIARRNDPVERLKTMVIVKMHMLRGCCNTASIKKNKIEKSIQEFIKEVEKFK